MGWERRNGSWYPTGGSSGDSGGGDGGPPMSLAGWMILFLLCLIGMIVMLAGAKL